MSLRQCLITFSKNMNMDMHMELKFLRQSAIISSIPHCHLDPG